MKKTLRTPRRQTRNDGFLRGSQEAAGFRRHRLPAARSPQERCSVLPSATSSGRLVPPRVGTVRGEQCRAHSEDPARTRVPSGDHGGPVGASVVRLGRGCFPAVPEERRAVGRRSTGFLPGRQPLRQRSAGGRLSSSFAEARGEGQGRAPVKASAGAATVSCRLGKPVGHFCDQWLIYGLVTSRYCHTPA